MKAYILTAEAEADMGAKDGALRRCVAISPSWNRALPALPLRALLGIYGISRVLRRLHHELEPQERHALAEAIECLSDEMLEKGCCA